MRPLPISLPGRLRAPLVSLLAVAAAMLCPAAASAAIEVQIANESGYEDAYLTVAGAGFDVDGEGAGGEAIQDNVPAQLGNGLTLTINKLISGRIYVSYKDGVTKEVPFHSPTRFDWAELTVHDAASEAAAASSDVANLTAVDQFGIGMRLDTYDSSDERLEWLGAANSNTVFQALQQIPGGPQATVRDGASVLRVLSPLQAPNAYPDLGDYVRSMSGKTITLHTAFFGSPFVTSQYSGTFAADGSIALSGTSNPAGQAPATIPVAGGGLIDDVYTGANTPNNLEGAIRRDLLAGFSTGLWGGRYGNDALSFCSNPQTTAQGSWCPNGFNRPAFGDARLELSPFPTCEQYAAVINQHADVYGNPYSDAAKKVQLGIDPGKVKTLKLTVLPDSGDAQPKASGNPNCGAGSSVPPSTPAQTGAAGPSGATAAVPHAMVGFRLRKRAQVRHGKVKIGRVVCPAACGRIRALARRGRKVLARKVVKRSGPKPLLVLGLTRFGRRALARHRRLKVRLDVWVNPRGRAVRHVRRPVFLVRGARR
jgi:hypothetical protein